MGGPRPRKIQISGIFDFGDFEAKLIDFVKEFSKETAPSKTEFWGLSSFSFGEGAVSLLNSFTKSMILGPKPPKSKIPEIWILWRPRAARQVCVKKARLCLHKLGPPICVSTRSPISLRKSKQAAEDVYLHKSAGRVCVKSAALFLHKLGGRPVASKIPDFGHFRFWRFRGQPH